MTTILKIDSSGQYKDSISRKLTARLAEKLLSQPGTNLIDRDVAKGLPVVTESWIGSNFTPKDDRSPEQAEILGLSDSLVEELRQADTLIIGMPIYNFSMPAALKNWVDLICRAGESFHYSESGPVGLLTGKRAYVVVASGGVPLGSPTDFASTYLTQVLNFVGITNITFISATATMANADGVVKKAEAEIDLLAAA